MEFSVGDKVVHLHHGPGRIAGVERRELLDGTKQYYVIEIPDRALIVHVPVHKADEAGVRPAMPQSKLLQVLRTLRGRPRRLPQNYRERQEEIWDRLKTRRVMQLAKVVRDLTWHGQRAPPTRKDSDYLKEGQQLLAAEMALVSGDDISDSTKLIDSTLAAALAGSVK
jgi:CarD family transcriptional regulator